MSGPRWSILTVPCLAVLILASVHAAPYAAAQATPSPVTGEQYTPVLQRVLAPPRWFTGADERVHLTYELILTNAFPVPVTVAAVDVLDPETGRVVALLEGDALSEAMSLLTTPTTPTVELPPATVTGPTLGYGELVWRVPAGSRSAVAATVPTAAPCRRSTARSTWPSVSPSTSICSTPKTGSVLATPV